MVQSIQREDKPVAQIAIGRVGKGQPLRLTILVPNNASFATAPTLLPPREGDAALAELTWRRCMAIGCTADTALTDEALQQMRGWTELGHVGFADAANRPVLLPFSARGLPQALDALAKEEN